MNWDGTRHRQPINNEFSTYWASDVMGTTLVGDIATSIVSNSMTCIYVILDLATKFEPILDETAWWLLRNSRQIWSKHSWLSEFYVNLDLVSKIEPKLDDLADFSSARFGKFELIETIFKVWINAMIYHMHFYHLKGLGSHHKALKHFSYAFLNPNYKKYGIPFLS
jgi:hypothetical protein